MISLFVIDDHFLIGSGFSSVFDPETDNINIAGYSLNVHDAIPEIKQIKIDVIILDLFIKFMDPVKNFRRLNAAFPKLPIVILSFEDSLEWKVNMFNEGAKAFLSKGNCKETMKSIILEVAAGNLVIPGEVMRSQATRFHTFPKPELLPEEKEILKDLSGGDTLKEIAQSHKRTISSIEKALKKVRESFNARTNCQLVSFLIRTKKI